MKIVLNRQSINSLICYVIIASSVNAQAGMLSVEGLNREKSQATSNTGEITPYHPGPVIFSETSLPFGQSGNITDKTSSVNQSAEHKWIADKGESLQSLVIRWAGYAGYQVVWEAPYDYNIDAHFELIGEFTEVIKQLFNEFGNADRPMRVDIYQKQKLIHISSL